MAKRLLARVKSVRESLGLSQEKFAENAGMTYKYYQHVEAGRKRDLRLSTLQKLAHACGVELSELLDFTTDPVGVGEEKPESGSKTSSTKGKRPSTKGSPGKGSRG
jgi:transcriptional regulator with XRE-family HTH domain